MPGEVTALIELLQDDDKRVLSAVRDRLLTLGPDVMDALRQAEVDGTAKVRSRARDVLATLERRRHLDALLALSRRSAPDLEEGAVLLASTHTPGVSHLEIRDELDRLADALATDLARARNDQERLAAFLGGLHQREGFGGDADSYYSWDNNFIHTVLRRRRGLPITLILLYILVGRRLDLQMTAVGAPYHALALYRTPTYETYVDAFDRGTPISRERCAASLARSGFHGPVENLLVELTDRMVLERILRNIVNFSEMHGRAAEAAEFHRVVDSFIAHRHLDPTT